MGSVSGITTVQVYYSLLVLDNLTGTPQGEGRHGGVEPCLTGCYGSILEQVDQCMYHVSLHVCIIMMSQFKDAKMTRKQCMQNFLKIAWP